jgi:hypothetical protein
MSAAAAAALRTFAFGNLDAGIWGSAWGAVEPIVAFGALHPGQVSAGAPASISGSSPAEEWSLSGDGIELTLSPESDPIASSELGGFDQLCRVTGHFILDGARREVDSLGHRGSRAEVDLREFESIRDVSAWFEPAEGLALTALRPRGATGHDRDVVIASVFDSTGAIEIADPRLSTTYTADGLPARVGLELWLQEDEQGEQYPRRAGGEALGVRAAAAQGELFVAAHAFRWHSRDQEGAGVYQLVRPR